MRVVFAVGLLSSLVAGVIAQDKKPEKRKLSDRTWIEGKVVCVSCTLENQVGGADVQHTKHENGLLMADGTLWSFVQNARGKYLIPDEKLRNKDVKVFGWKFSKAQHIEIFKYSLKDGAKWIALDYCKNCGFEEGDFKDTDLCSHCKE